MLLIEVIALAASLLYVVLNAQQRIATWLFGLAGSLLYCWVFGQAELYGSAWLSFFFACVMVYGFFRWRKTDGEGQSLLVSRMPFFFFCAGIAGASLLSVVLFYVLRQATENPLLAGDSVIAGFSVFAQILATQKKLESWGIWLFVNLLATVIYFMGGLQGTSFLYLVYTALSVYGYVQWKRELNQRAGQV